MPRITISYRRDDSDVITGRIFDRLSAHYGRETVFRDIDSIPAGVDFRKYVNTVIDGTDIMVAVVGPKWIGPRPGQSRLDNAADPVRVEVDAALRKGVPLIPVLVLRAQMPRADQLPPSLEDFAYRNAARIDAGQDFDTHMGRLIRAIDNVLSEKAQSSTGEAVDASSPAEPAVSPSAPSTEDGERQRFAEQLQREEEARQRQVEEDRQRDIADARRRDEEERQGLLAEQRRLQEDRDRLVAEQRRLDEEARQIAERREREETERQAVEQARLEAAAGQAAEQRDEKKPHAAPQPQAAPMPGATTSGRLEVKYKVAIGAGLAGLAIAILVVILVSHHPVPPPPPPPTPVPAPVTPSQIQSGTPAVQNPSPPAPAQNPTPAPQSLDGILAPGQVWSLTFFDKGNIQYNGKLTIAQTVSYNSFTGHIEISYKDTDGTSKSVREDALVTINDTKITISCSNAQYLQGSGTYAADYFDFTVKSRVEADGTNVDDKNFSGRATMRRN
jgi:hypothetical protein